MHSINRGALRIERSISGTDMDLDATTDFVDLSGNLEGEAATDVFDFSDGSLGETTTDARQGRVVLQTHTGSNYARLLHPAPDGRELGAAEHGTGAASSSERSKGVEYAELSLVHDDSYAYDVKYLDHRIHVHTGVLVVIMWWYRVSCFVVLLL